MGTGKSDENSLLGIEMVSVFLDGELDEEGCERLLASAHGDAGVGLRLSCYGLIREVIRDHDWRHVPRFAPRPAAWHQNLWGSFGRSWHAFASRPALVWTGACGLLACTLVAVLLLGPVREPPGVGALRDHVFPGLSAHAGLNRPEGRYGEVRSVSWNTPSSAVRQQLETYWMLHAASLSGSQMMGYPRMAAYNYSVAGRKQGWRHHP